MASVYDLPTAIYRFDGDLRNLRVRVTVRCATGHPIQDEVSPPPEEGESAGGKRWHQKAVVVGWQHKVFGRREVYELRCGATSNRPGALDELIALDEEARATGNEEFVGESISTYIDGDTWRDPDEWCYRPTSSCGGSTYLAGVVLRAMHEEGNRAGPQRPRRRADLPPPVVERARRDLIGRGWKTMYIVLTVDDDAREKVQHGDLPTWLGREHTLCRLRASAAGRLEMTPGFSCAGDEEWFRFFSPLGTAFEYRLENVSHVHSAAVAARVFREQRLAHMLSGRWKEAQRREVGTEFVTPPDGVTIVHVMGEIVSAQDFEMEDLCVSYEWDVPEGWKLTQETPLSATSQICSRGSIAHFGFPLEGELWKESGSWEHHPRVFLQVSSHDTWDRYCIEGYGYVDIPLCTGLHTRCIRMWKPFPTVRERLRGFFVGGSPQLKDLRCVVDAPRPSGAPVVSKYGFVTETTGSVEVRLHVVIQASTSQRRAPILPLLSRKGSQHLTSAVDPSKSLLDRVREQLHSTRRFLAGTP